MWPIQEYFCSTKGSVGSDLPWNGKKYSVCTFLPGSSHRVSVFCYCTALLECWLIETENESIFKKLSISWRDGELFHKSDPRRKHSAQGNPWYHLLQQPLSHRENFGFQGFYNHATSSQFSFLVRCLTAFSCHSTTENCIFTVPWGTWGCCGQRWHVQELWHFQGLRNSLSQASYATAWWLRSSALGRCICLVEHSSYSLGAKESGKASVNCHLLLL